MLNLYSFFHLNILFSSIEKDQRKIVIDKCYWPILELIKFHKIPIAIEAPAITLEIINEIDKSWIEQLKKLIHSGECEFIGSGYTQLIGALVPWKINLKNQFIGQSFYKDILNFNPNIALINEQAFSSNLIPIYLDAGYETIIMEWNNSFSYKEWNREISFFRQNTISKCGKKIDIVWNNSINFQRFQRYVHSEISYQQFIHFIYREQNNLNRNFLLYGSDAEIFNFRPGRFSNEAKIVNCEWEKINKLFVKLKEEKNFNLIFPSEVNFSNDKTLFKENLILNSPQNPIVVKKQSKYNIFRWGVTGRNDLHINSKCYSIFKKIENLNCIDDSNYRELIYLWSSDFRTHITESRWNKYIQRLLLCEDKFKNLNANKKVKQVRVDKHVKTIKYKVLDNLIEVEFGDTKVTFNKNKGLAIDSYINRNFSRESIFGTIKHGSFDDINWGADFFSGNLNFQSPGKPQATDLSFVNPEIQIKENKLFIQTIINTSCGQVYKSWSLNPDEYTMSLKYKFNWPNAGLGKLSIVPITLNPNIFEETSLYYEASNGGKVPEKFYLQNQEVDHIKNVSFLVSSNYGLGLTDGKFVIGDNKKNIEIIFDPSLCAFLGQVVHKKVDNAYFTRFILTGREFDDTAKYNSLDISTEIMYKINILS